MICSQTALSSLYPTEQGRRQLHFLHWCGGEDKRNFFSLYRAVESAAEMLQTVELQLKLCVEHRDSGDSIGEHQGHAIGRRLQTISGQVASLQVR